MAKHIKVIIVCGVVSLFFLPVVMPFAGMGTFSLVLTALGAILLSHLMGFLISSGFKSLTAFSTTIISFVCFLPLFFLFGLSIKEKIYLNYYAPTDRFQELLMNPVPKSANQIHFPSKKEEYRGLVLTFNIAPFDFDKIVVKHSFALKGHQDLLKGKDLFYNPKYFDLGLGYELYQAIDIFHNVMTIKANKKHTKVVFRYESVNEYGYQEYMQLPEEIRKETPFWNWVYIRNGRNY